MAQVERGIKLREWTIEADDYVYDDGYDEAAFRAAVAAELAILEHMGERFGLGFVVAPIRAEKTPGRFKTVAWVFKSETIPAAEYWQPAEIDLGDENTGTGGTTVGEADPEPVGA